MTTSDTSSPSRGVWFRRHLFLVATAALCLLVLLCAGAVLWVRTIPERVDDQQTLVLGQQGLIPGGQAGLRLLVRNLGSEQPIEDARVQVMLGGRERVMLYEGRTDRLGTADVRFRVPDDLPENAELLIKTASRAGQDEIVRKVEAVRPVRLILTTDKPVYQPGQIIHMRVLALSATDMQPAQGAALSLVVEDARGNKVFRKAVTTSDFGIAWADFTLAEQVNQGKYKVTAGYGETTSEKTVTVKWYVLPRFKVDVTTDKPFYLPGETVNGHVQAGYFFGKPVVDGTVTVAGSTYDVERHAVAEVQGATGEDGGFDFAIQAPSYLAGGAPEAQTAAYSLETQVVDRAGHAEATTTSVPIANAAILLDAVPESGQLRRGVENIVYVLATYPDGTPARVALDVTYGDGRLAAETGSEGVAEVRITPQASFPVLQIAARDQQGRTADRSFELAVDLATAQVLLRPDRPVYRAGDTMTLEIYATDGRTVYLDAVRDQQTLLLRAADVEAGKATFQVDVSPDLVGTLALHAYAVLREGTIVRDTRIVVVNTPSDIDVAMTADKEVYRPGEAAKLAFQLSREGQPVPGVLGISIVDESVFSVEEQDPGLARLYFLLEAELLQPRYQIKDTLEPILLAPPVPPSTAPGAAQDAQQLASAQARLAQAPVAALAWEINSHIEKLRAADGQQKAGFSGAGIALTLIVACLPASILVLAWITLRRRAVLKAALRPFWITLGVVILGSIVILPGVAWLVYSLAGLFGRGAIALAALLWLACPIVLGIDARRRRDEPGQFVALMLLAWAILYPLMLYALFQGQEVRIPALILMVVGNLVGVAGIYLWGLGLIRQGARGGAVAAIVLAALAVPALLLVAFTPAIAGAPGPDALAAAAFSSPAGLLSGCAAMPVPLMPGMARPTEAPAAAEALPGAAPERAQQEPPRLRQYFPETLAWEPALITDETGRAALEIPMADSITTWRVSAQASTARGELGGLTAGVRVFQDFFVDLDLPVALTQGDEIALPVSVFNYLAEPQEVRLELAREPWFELLDAPTRTLAIGPHDVTAVRFRIRALEFGRQRLTVTAWGSRASDAIARELRVLPDGKEIRRTTSNWLKDGARGTVRIPANAVAGTPRIEVKVYPGLLSQVIEGIDGLLRMPFG